MITDVNIISSSLYIPFNIHFLYAEYCMWFYETTCNDCYDTELLMLLCCNEIASLLLLLHTIQQNQISPHFIRKIGKIHKIY